MLKDIPKDRVLNGLEWKKFNQTLKENRSALPAVCVSSPSTANAAMAAAAQVNSPIIILTSFGAGHFNAGKSLPKTPEVWAAGAASIAHHVHTMAPYYGVPVILATDHCSMENRKWLDCMLAIDKENAELTGRALWSGHMADFSASTLDDALPVYKELLGIHHSLGIIFEYELGETGGEEDGISGTASYTSPEEAAYVYGELREISDLTTAALTFGNVHGVYKGDFDLRPDILGACQAKVREKFGLQEELPMDLVFHGGSGCTPSQMEEALKYGTVKQNIDTDTQFAFTCGGIVPTVLSNLSHLQSQVGSPTDAEHPNKKFYDPRGLLHKGELAMTARIVESFGHLNSVGLLD